MTHEEAKAVTTIDLDKQLDYYYQLQQERDRINQSLEIAKGTIMESFKYLGMRQYHSLANNLVDRVDTRVSERISAKEAKELLPEDLYQKLAKESVSIVFSVKKLKGE